MHKCDLAEVKVAMTVISEMGVMVTSNAQKFS